MAERRSCEGYHALQGWRVAVPVDVGTMADEHELHELAPHDIRLRVVDDGRVAHGRHGFVAADFDVDLLREQLSHAESRGTRAV